MSNVPKATRRSVLLGGSAAVAALAMPRISRAASRPLITHGLQSGDVSATSGVVWTRADRPARVTFEIATTESFKDPLTSVWVDALPESDFAVKALLEGLPSDQDLFYRAVARDLSDVNGLSEPLVGRFRTAPAEKRDVTFVWSGDTAGQGWGIDEARGGMALYATMQRNKPDFFIHSGDTIYADGVISAEAKLPDGTMWKNIVTEEVSKAAETLNEYRGRYKYNLLDKNMLAFNAEVPMFAQWDDHEVTNNWSSSKQLGKAYTEKAIGLLSARAARAFHEYMPIAASPEEAARVYRKAAYGPLLDVFFLDMRSYRGPNGVNTQTEEGPDTVFLGAIQLAWLKRELKASNATWKVIAADMPLSLIVYDDAANKAGSEAVAQGDGGAPLGRELEIAHLLSAIKQMQVKNVVWLTADVHYTAAHRYDPNKAKFQDFEPFWEFVSGPAHAGTFGPNQLDATFGPEAVYVKAPEDGKQNLSPAAGMQFFGHVKIDGKTEQMTVTLKDVADAALWSTTLDPVRG